MLEDQGGRAIFGKCIDETDETELI